MSHVSLALSYMLGEAELAKLTQGRVPYATAALDFVRSRLALLEDA